MMTFTAFDGGYNAIKALATNGREAFFPSVVGEKAAGSGFDGIDPGEHTLSIELDDGTTWTAGGTALQESAYVSSRRDPGWVLSPSYRVLLCAALSELHKATTTTKIVTGLPLQDYATHSGKLADTLTGRHTFKRNGDNWQTITVEKTIVVTQPYGSLLDAALSDGGKILSNAFTTGIVGVADLGGNTLNLLCADSLNEIGRWTAGDGLGMLSALQAIGQAIRARSAGVNPKAREVSDWLAAGVYPFDKTLDIVTLARPMLEPVIQAILAKMADVWTEPGRFGAVLLTGGGAMALGRALKERMDGVYPNVTIAESANFANVRGYLKLARRLWG